MDDQLHIIITGDRGKVISLPCSRKKLRLYLIFSAILFLTLTVAGSFSISLLTENRAIGLQLDELREQLRTNIEMMADEKRDSDEQQLKLNLKVAKLELSSVRQAAAFREEKENLLSTAVSELAERSELIEKMIDSIGIELPEVNQEDKKHSGGRFIEHPDAKKNELLHRADKYLKAIRFLPFGRPVDGPISSGFGTRYDPINGKLAVHTGIDFRSKTGDKIFATADGVVQKAFYNGSFGNYVLIEHNNGYATSFSHMQKYVVHAGTKVKRGQLIGYVGNSGRSTGTHLHYEITLDGDPVNPYKFMKVANLSESTPPSSETR